MLAVLLYHQVVTTERALELFKKHIQQLKNCHFVVPGEKLASNKTNVCLTFDDAYADFYYHIYPLLREQGIPSVLAIPTAFMTQRTVKPMSQRLAVTYPNGLAAAYQKDSPLCTWQELQEMTASGCVIPASHGHQHLALRSEADVTSEILVSKALLEHYLQTPVTTFVYPYGVYKRSLFRRVRQVYRYSFRIGSALNWGWSQSRVLYRIDAESLWRSQRPLVLSRYYGNFWLNRLRMK